MLSAFGLAIFSAFAFKPAEKSTLAVHKGYIQTSPGNCENKMIDCQDVDNGQPCLFGAVQLRRLNASGTSCPTLLWKIDQ